VKTQEDTTKDPHDPEPAAEGEIQMEYSSDYYYCKKFGH